MIVARPVATVAGGGSGSADFSRRPRTQPPALGAERGDHHDVLGGLARAGANDVPAVRRTERPGDLELDESEQAGRHRGRLSSPPWRQGDFVLRPAEPADAAVIAAITAAGFETYRSFAPPNWSPWVPTAQETLERFGIEGAHSVVAVAGDDIVARRRARAGAVTAATAR